MTSIMRLMDRMEQKEKAVKAGPCFTQLEGRVGQGNEKVGEKRRFRDACDVGGEGAGQGLRGEGGGAAGEKRPSTSRVAFKAKEERSLWRRESVPCPRKAMRPKRSSLKKEAAASGEVAKTKRKRRSCEVKARKVPAQPQKKRTS